MNRLLISGTFLLVFSTLFLAFAEAQQQTGTTPSLGELARQLKSQRDKAGPKAAKVFTNDNLPTGQPPLGPTDTATTSTSPEPKGDKSAATDLGSSPSKTGSSQAHDEKYFRQAMAELRRHKEMHERELSVLQTKLAQNEMQYYPDPYKKAVQEYTRADINKVRQEIDKKKAEIAGDDKAMDDLQEQLRREGAPPGWLR